MERMPLVVAAAAVSALAVGAVVVSVETGGPEPTPTRVADSAPSRAEQEAAWRQQALDDLADRLARDVRQRQQALDETGEPRP